MSEASTAPCGALSRDKAAAFLSVSTRFLDDLLSSGKIPKLKAGRKTLVRVCDLDAYLASLVVEGSSDA